MKQWLRLLSAFVVLGPAVPLETTSPPVRAVREDSGLRGLVLSDQARRFLALAYRSFPTEFMGCMIGEVRDSVAYIERIAPADVEPSHSTASWVVPTQTCESAGWTGTVGIIHSHPAGTRCWYFFPGTQVLSSDGQSFLRSPYALDAIMCGEHVVWIAREMVQRQVALAGAGDGQASVAAAP